MFENLNVIAAFILQISTLTCLLCALLYLGRKKGNFRSNRFLSAFFLVFGLSLFRNGLLVSNMMEVNMVLSSPLWNTLWFGPLFFYYIKLNIYPHYLLRKSDIKHFILPLLQLIIHIALAITSLVSNQNFEQQFNDLASVEGVLYLFTFFPYIILSFRYIKFAQASEKLNFWRKQKLFWLKKITQVLYLLAFVNALYLVLNFLSKFVFMEELLSLTSYYLFSELSFGLIATWICYQAIKLLRGKAYKYWEAKEQYSFEKILQKEHIFLDADLDEKYLPIELEKAEILRQINKQRAIFLRQLMEHPQFKEHDLKSLIFRSGYPNHWIYNSKT